MVRKFIYLFIFLYSVTALSQQDSSQSALVHYEKGLLQQQHGDFKSAEISFKNSIQQDLGFLPARLALGEVLLELGNVESAKKELQLALSMKADTQAVILPLVRAHLLLNQYQLALDLLAQYSSLSTQQNYALYQGNALLALRKFDLAAEAFEREFTMFGGSVELYTSQAQLYQQQNNLVMAAQKIEQALSIDADNIPVLLLRSQLEKQQGDVDQALLTLEQILATDDTNSQALFGKAYLLVEQGKLQAALDLVLSLRRKDDNNPFAKLLHATIISQQGDNRQAKRLLADIQQQLMGITDKFKQQQQILLLSASVEMSNQNYHGARKKFKQLLDLYGDDYGALKSMATIEFRLQNIEAAERYLKRALAMQDDDADVYMLLSQAYKLTNKQDEVLPLLATAFEKLPANKQLQMHYASALADNGKQQLAINVLSKGNNQSSIINRTMLGYLLLESNNYPEALNHTQTLLAEFPDKVEILQLAGELSVKTNNIVKASELFQRAIVLAPEFKPPYFALAGIAINNNDFDEAEQYYQRLLSLDENDEVVRNLYADLAIKNGWYTKAIELLNYNLSIKNYKKNRALLSLYMKTNQFNMVEKLLAPLLVEYRLDENLLLTKAKLAIEQKQWPVAQKTLKILFGMAYDSAEKLKVLAHIQIDARDLEGTQATLNRLKAVDSSMLDDYLLTRTALLNEDFVTAGDIVKRNLSAQNNNLKWQELNVYVLLGKKDFDGAITRLNSLLTENNHRQHMQLLAQVYSQQDKKAELTQLLSQWLTSTPSDAWAIAQLSQIYHGNGDFELARQTLERYPFIDNNPIFLNNLANYYLDIDLDKALTYAEKAYQLTPEIAAINDTLGWVYVKQGNINQGVSLLREASVRDNSNGEILYHLAYGLIKMDSVSQAKLVFDKAVKLMPEHQLRSQLSLKLGAL